MANGLLRAEKHPETGRPVLDNEDGSFSTEESITVTHPRLNDGKPTNIPSIWNGKRPPMAPSDPGFEDYVVEQALKSGQKFPSFNSIDEAVSAAKERSEWLGRSRPGEERGMANGLLRDTPSSADWNRKRDAEVEASRKRIDAERDASLKRVTEEGDERVRRFREQGNDQERRGRDDPKGVNAPNPDSDEPGQRAPLRDNIFNNTYIRSRQTTRERNLRTPATPEDDQRGEAVPNVSEEEQAAKDAFVTKAWDLTYDEDRFPTVMESVYGAGDPVTGLASTTALLVSRLYDGAVKAGQPISPDIMLHGGIEILEDLAETAGRAKLHDFTPQELEAATLRAMDMTRDMLTQAGHIDPRVLQQEFGQLVQADRAGKLGELLPGIEQATMRSMPGMGERDPAGTHFSDVPGQPGRPAGDFDRQRGEPAPMRTTPPDRGEDANEIPEPWWLQKRRPDIEEA